MKPELANLYTIATSGVQNDFVMSFFYEWRETEDGTTVEIKKQKVASVVLSSRDFVELTDIMTGLKAQLLEGEQNG